MEISPEDRARELKAVWRRQEEQLAGQDPTAPRLRIGLAASFTANSLIPFLGAPLVEAGFNPSIALGPYQQLFQVCLDHPRYFHPEPEVLILLHRLEDIALAELLDSLHGDATASARARAKIDLFISALRSLRDTFAGTIIVNLPPFPASLPAHPLNLENPLGLGCLHHTLTIHFLTQAGDIPGLRFCDLDAVQRECGRSTSFDAQQWYLYRQPFTDSFLLQAGSLLARLVAALRRAPKKCVVLDCDNTLWGGIIGEDGIAGIQLGDDFPGTAYRDFQRLLLHWRRHGVFLALASKNNEADVWEVFEKHSGMLLRREHISAWQINWKSKGENISHIARSLNIGLDSLVFIDDSPMEIESMRAAQPEVAGILLPDDPADILETLRSLTLFDQLDITPEDRRRADRMRAEQQRESLGRGLSGEEFRKSLGLHLEFFLARPVHLERITQLINKTNQFNLSTIRRSLDEVRQLARSPRHRIFGLQVADNYGDYGLTGVVIAEIPDHRSELIIDTLLLSCRVLGRGVETALLAALAEEARTEGASEIVATFIPSAKNAPAAAFLADHGFRAEDDQRRRIAISQVPALCPSITLLRSGAPALEI